MIYAAFAHLFAVMSPGPDTAIIIREVSINKRRGGLFCAFGIGVGILIHCYLAIFGISTLLLSNNFAGDLISMFGSFYLIFIGISSFKSESQTSKKSQLMSSSFINGFVTNIFNENLLYLGEKCLVVQPGNSLWRISRKTWGGGMLYTEIYKRNIKIINNPDLIYPGQVLTIPIISEKFVKE